MSEVSARRELYHQLATRDPNLMRFGARQHRYELLPPIGGAALARVEDSLGCALPAPYREYVAEVSEGGLGPYYGLIPVERATGFVLPAPAGVSGWQRALPISHLGCGYLAVIALDGPASGQVWIDARELGIVEHIERMFEGFLSGWLSRLTRGEWLDGFVPVGRCGLQAALTGYLHVCEQQMGVADGQLAGAELREALAGLGPGSIAIGTDSPLWHDRENVDPCVICARVVENLVAAGLTPAVIAPGLPPIPARS